MGPPKSKSQTASQSVQPSLHSSRQKVAILYNGPPFSPLKLPLPTGGSGPYGSLGPPTKSWAQMASWSVQPFLHSSLQCVHILYNGLPLPLEIVPSHGGSGPPSNTWFPGPTRVLNPNGILIGSAIFSGLQSWQTTLLTVATQSVRICRIYVHSMCNAA